MFLSSLLINVGDNPDRPRPGRTWLRNLYHVHQRLCMAFPSYSKKSDDKNFLEPFKPDDFGKGQVHVPRYENSGFLYRIDSFQGNRVVILVQSAIEPDWDYAFHNADFLLGAPPEIKTYDPVFKSGQSLRFRLVTNPTRKIDTKTGDDGKKRNGKRVPVHPDKFNEWIINKGEKSGFTVEQVSFQAGYYYFNKNGHNSENEKSRLRSVRFEGTLEVKDPNLFKETLFHGVGSGKAFGFGLLSVIPME